MTFQPNMLTLWLLALVVLLAAAKTLLRVGRVLLDKTTDTFDIRRLPEFLGDDILFEVGGLLVLSIFTFLSSTGLPEAFAALLYLVQGIFYASALSLCGKYVAKIRDIYKVPDDTSDVSAEDRAIADSAAEELAKAAGQ